MFISNELPQLLTTSISPAYPSPRLFTRPSELPRMRGSFAYRDTHTDFPEDSTTIYTINRLSPRVKYLGADYVDIVANESFSILAMRYVGGFGMFPHISRHCCREVEKRLYIYKG